MSASLGRPRKILRHNLIGIGLGAVGLAVALMCAGMAIGPPNFGADDNSTFLCALGAILLLMAPIDLLHGLAHRRLRLTVYEHGLAYTDDSTRAALRWEEIDFVSKHYNAGRSTEQVYPKLTWAVIGGRDGSRITCDLRDIRRGPQVAEYIQRKALPQILPRYLAAFQAGQTLRLGELEISQAGLTFRGKMLPWDQVTTVDGHDDWCVDINARWGWAWASVDFANKQILDTAALLALIEQVGEGRIKVRSPKPLRL